MSRLPLSKKKREKTFIRSGSFDFQLQVHASGHQYYCLMEIGVYVQWRVDELRATAPAPLFVGLANDMNEALDLIEEKILQHEKTIR